MRSDRNVSKSVAKTKKRLMIIAALCILLIGFAVGGSIINSYYSELNYYNSDEGVQARDEIDKKIADLKDEQRAEWIKNDRSERYYEIEEEINSLIEIKNKRPSVRIICYGIFPMIGAFTFAIPLIVLSFSKKRQTT